MEFYNFCLKVILKEMKEFDIDTELHASFVKGLVGTQLMYENFELPQYRCAYMHRHATSNIYFFKECIKYFLLQCPHVKEIISVWKLIPELKVCSLSVGPGLDYLAFMIAMLEYDPLIPNFNDCKIISKHCAWKYTVNLISEVIQAETLMFGYPQTELRYSNVEVIQADVLECFTGNCTSVPSSDAHVVLMMKALNFGTPGSSSQEEPLLKMLMELLSSLRTDAIIFCIDTKPSLDLFKKALSNFSGRFLLDPKHLESKIPVNFLKFYGCQPGLKNRGYFVVWQKLSSSLTTNICSILNVPPIIKECKDSYDEGNSTPACTGGDDMSPPLPCYTKLKVKIPSSTFHVEESQMNVKFSEILPWRELPPGKIPWGEIFWQNASPITRASLKSVMFLKKENLDKHWIGEVARLYQSEYPTANPDSTSKMVEVDISTNSSQLNVQLIVSKECEKSDVLQTQLTQTSNLNNINYFCSEQESTLNAEDSSIYTAMDSSPSAAFLNDESNLSYKTSIICDPAVQAVGPLIKGVSNETISLPVKVKASNATLMHISMLANDNQSLVKEESTKEEVNINVESTVTKHGDAVKPLFETNLTQAHAPENIPTNTNSTSVKALTERIGQLVTSFENLSYRNVHRNCSKANFSSPHDNYHDQQMHNYVSDNGSCDNIRPSCSTHEPNHHGSTEKHKSTKVKVCSAEKNMYFQSRCLSCRNPCNMSHYGCPMQCHFQPCHEQRCNCSRLPCRESQSFVNTTSPSIVIPLHNISDEALLRLVSILKSG